MSQILRIVKTKMVEREFLIKALEDLSCEWEEKSQRIGLLGPQVDIALKGVRPYVGLRKSPTGYEAVSVGAGSRESADFVKRLTQRYVYHAARAKLEKQGFALASEEVKENGRIHLVLRRVV